MSIRLVKVWAVIVLLIGISACSSVTVRPYGGEKVTSKPDFQRSNDYYWWGLKGEYEINTRDICQEKRVMQMQAVNTPSDWIFQILTLGIYLPRTSKVWCEEK